MGLPNGVHHLAIGTRDIKAQIEFFTQVVGMELVALYWMHGVPDTVHGFHEEIAALMNFPTPPVPKLATG